MMRVALLWIGLVIVPDFISAEEQTLWNAELDKAKVNYHRSRICVIVDGEEKCVSRDKAPGDRKEIEKLFSLVHTVVDVDDIKPKDEHDEVVVPDTGNRSGGDDNPDGSGDGDGGGANIETTKDSNSEKGSKEKDKTDQRDRSGEKDQNNEEGEIQPEEKHEEDEAQNTHKLDKIGGHDESKYDKDDAHIKHKSGNIADNDNEALLDDGSSNKDELDKKEKRFKFYPITEKLSKREKKMGRIVRTNVNEEFSKEHNTGEERKKRLKFKKVLWLSNKKKALKLADYINNYN